MKPCALILLSHRSAGSVALDVGAATTDNSAQWVFRLRCLVFVILWILYGIGLSWTASELWYDGNWTRAAGTATYIAMRAVPLVIDIPGKKIDVALEMLAKRPVVFAVAVLYAVGLTVLGVFVAIAWKLMDSLPTGMYLVACGQVLSDLICSCDSVAKAEAGFRRALKK